MRDTKKGDKMSVGMIGQILEWGLLAIILISALIGSNRGFLLSVFAMVKNLLTIIAAAASAPIVVSRLSKSWPVREAIGYGIALVIWMLVFGIIARLIRIADDLPIVSTVNRLLGFVFGVVSGLLVVWTILAILGGVQEYSWAVQIVKAARANSVVMWLQSYSPIMIILKMMDFPVI